jgi:hypothetical protein
MASLRCWYCVKLPGKLASLPRSSSTMRVHAVEEGTVVGDEKQRDTAFDQQVFQPFDGGDIEVVGRLVQQQHLGRNGQGLGQGQALFLTAGQAADAGIGSSPKRSITRSA